MKSCGNYGKINTTESNYVNRTSVGGIVGDSHYIEITNCYNLGNIESNINKTTVSAGGIIGEFNTSNNTNYVGKINGCYNSGQVNAYINSGGILGWGNNATIIDCYNTGDILATNYAAGGITFLMDTNSSIINCYNIGNVTASYNTTHCGSLLGDYSNGVTLTNNYVLTGSSNYAIGSDTGGWDDWEGHIQVKSATDMKSLASTLGSNWKSDEENENNGYPILSWQ